MGSLWLAVAAILAVLEWVALAADRRRAIFVLKPAVMVALLGWLVDQRPGWSAGWIWFFLAALFSLIGDSLLLLSSSAFKYGLAAFLLAHLAYIVGLNQDPLPINPATFAIVLGVAAVFLRTARRLAAGSAHHESVPDQPDPGWTHRSPFPQAAWIYITALAGTLISALNTLIKLTWEPAPALLAAAGGLLFVVSDLILAWERFVEPIAYGRVKIHITYHLAQFALLIGAGLHFGLV